jgi:hypothetical protein
VAVVLEETVVELVEQIVLQLQAQQLQTLAVAAVVLATHHQHQQRVVTADQV